MKLSLKVALLVAAMSDAPRAYAQVCELPDIVDIIGLAFPTFEVDTDGTKIEGSAGRWTPLYFTKRYNGLDHPVSS
jgi:hypothetical protein